ATLLSDRRANSPMREPKVAWNTPSSHQVCLRGHRAWQQVTITAGYQSNRAPTLPSCLA
ncbi:molybdopterin oxidoreductase family protein, partial [Vibrio parahaemolyticus V-223/04]